MRNFVRQYRKAGFHNLQVLQETTFIEQGIECSRCRVNA